VVVALLVGGTYVAWQSGPRVGFGGLIGILVLVSAVVLAFTGRYPRPLFDLILGLNRWVLRVAAYATLMTDVYPPFRLDTGEGDPAGTLTVQPPAGPAVSGAVQASRAWTPGRIIALIVGAALTIFSVAPIAAGGFGLWLDNTQRDSNGYLNIGEETYATDGYALTTLGAEFRFEEPAGIYVPQTLGDFRVRVEPRNSDQRVFVGIAREGDVEAYLDGVARAVVTRAGNDAEYRTVQGRAPTEIPRRQTFWTASSEGVGTREIEVPVREGSWALVVMNADGSAGVDVRADAGATLPVLGWLAPSALAFGVALLVAGVLILSFAIIRASRVESRVRT
jgi:hypothetical protein